MRKNSSKQHGVNSILNRSQSAMEYLMTYGWAILIIAIVLVALFSLGIFNSANFAPRAQPGSCEVLKNSAQTSLVGQCNGMLPEYVAQFNGNTSQIKLPILSGFTSSGGYTILFWMYIKNQYASGSTACGGPPRTLVAIGTNQNKIYMQGDGSIVPYFPATANLWSYSSGQYYGIGTAADLNIGTWYMIAGTVNTTAQCIYLGSKPYCQAGLSATFSNIPGLIGGNDSCGLTFNGSISNVQIYNTSLSNSSIKTLYKEGIGGAPINVNNLVGWWPLNGNANDYSGNDNNGVPTNVIYTSAWTSGYSAP